MCNNLWIIPVHQISRESYNFHSSGKCGGYKACKHCSQGITHAGMETPICSKYCFCRDEITQEHFTEAKNRILHHIEVLLLKIRRMWPAEKIFLYDIGTKKVRFRRGEVFTVEFLIMKGGLKLAETFSKNTVCDCQLETLISHLGSKIKYCANSVFEDYSFITHFL